MRRVGVAARDVEQGQTRSPSLSRSGSGGKPPLAPIQRDVGQRATYGHQSVENNDHSHASRRWVWIVVVVVLIIAGAIGVVLFGEHRSETSPHTRDTFKLSASTPSTLDRTSASTGYVSQAESEQMADEHGDAADEHTAESPTESHADVEAAAEEPEQMADEHAAESPTESHADVEAAAEEPEQMADSHEEVETAAEVSEQMADEHGDAADEHAAESPTESHADVEAAAEEPEQMTDSHEEVETAAEEPEQMADEHGDAADEHAAESPTESHADVEAAAEEPEQMTDSHEEVETAAEEPEQMADEHGDAADEHTAESPTESHVDVEAAAEEPEQMTDSHEEVETAAEEPEQMADEHGDAADEHTAESPTESHVDVEAAAEEPEQDLADSFPPPDTPLSPFMPPPHPPPLAPPPVPPPPPPPPFIRSAVQLAELKSNIAFPITPKFHPQITEYFMTIPRGLPNVVLMARMKESDAVLKFDEYLIGADTLVHGSGVISVPVGGYTTATFTVESRNRMISDLTSTYTVTIYRRSDDLEVQATDARLTALVVQANLAQRQTKIQPKFNAKRLGGSYTVKIPHEWENFRLLGMSFPGAGSVITGNQVQKLELTAATAASAGSTYTLVCTFAAVDPGAHIFVDGTDCGVDMDHTRGRDIIRKLKVGQNDFNITVISANGMFSASYYLNVYREADKSAELLEKATKSRGAEMLKTLNANPGNQAVARAAHDNDAIFDFLKERIERCMGAPNPWTPLLPRDMDRKRKHSRVEISDEDEKGKIDSIVDLAMKTSLRLRPPAKARSPPSPREKDEVAELIEQLGMGRVNASEFEDCDAKESSEEKAICECKQYNICSKSTMIAMDRAAARERRARTASNAAEAEPAVTSENENGEDGPSSGARRLLGGAAAREVARQFARLKDSNDRAKPSDAPKPAFQLMQQRVHDNTGQFFPDGTSRELNAIERKVAGCLRDFSSCPLSADEMTKTLMKLKSMSRFSKARLRCATLGGADCSSSSTTNPETGSGASALKRIRAAGIFSPLPTRRLRTCAVVGNAPGVALSTLNGGAINRHDAVFRVNLAPTLGYERHVGNRTFVRVMDARTLRKFTDTARGNMPQPSLLHHDLHLDSLDSTYHHFGIASPNDGMGGWALWHYGMFSDHSRDSQILSMTKRVAQAGQSLHVVHPDMISWQADAAFSLMRDTIRLGMAPKRGPGSGWGYPTFASLSSGMHALLMATQMCDRVNVFGFSLAATSAAVPGAVAATADGVPRRYYGAVADSEKPGLWRNHAWQFEANALKLLALSGAVNVCS